ncbi:MAG: homoserine kinase [Sporolactobacillus sp.]
MSTNQTFTIKVPGSTSNLGPGFDSIGMAVDRYLVLRVARADSWSFCYLDLPEFCPPVNENLIYQTAKRLADLHHALLPCCSIDIRSDIPLARGLGSSGAAIIAGIELANYLLDLNLPNEEKAWFACRAEGHPDNVTASLYGGLVVSAQSTEQVESVCLPVPDFSFVTLIPNFELRTSEARRVLPASLSHKEAVEGSSVANVLICALLEHNGPLAGKMMESDRFHQSYRSGLLPHFSKARMLAKKAGAFGTFLSGAGPTLMSLAARQNDESIQKALQEGFPDYQCFILHPVSRGSICEKEFAAGQSTGEA